MALGVTLSRGPVPIRGCDWLLAWVSEAAFLEFLLELRDPLLFTFPMVAYVVARGPLGRGTDPLRTTLAALDVTDFTDWLRFDEAPLCGFLPRLEPLSLLSPAPPPGNSGVQPLPAPMNDIAGLQATQVRYLPLVQLYG